MVCGNLYEGCVIFQYVTSNLGNTGVYVEMAEIFAYLMDAWFMKFWKIVMELCSN